MTIVERMNDRKFPGRYIIVMVAIFLLIAQTGCSKSEEAGDDAGAESSSAAIVPPPPAPPEYAEKHMPKGWWNDPEIIAQGQQLFIGAENPDVNCAACHGRDGKPVKKGARDFRQTERMKLYSDSQWFWRVSEGVKGTKMPAWKKKLPREEDRWKIIAFERTFGLDGMGWDVARNAWVPVDQLGMASPAAGAPAAEGETVPVSVPDEEGAPGGEREP